MDEQLTKLLDQLTPEMAVTKNLFDAFQQALDETGGTNDRFLARVIPELLAAIGTLDLEVQKLKHPAGPPSRSVWPGPVDGA